VVGAKTKRDKTPGVKTGKGADGPVNSVGATPFSWGIRTSNLLEFEPTPKVMSPRQLETSAKEGNGRERKRTG